MPDILTLTQGEVMIEADNENRRHEVVIIHDCLF